ncbi:MAG: universal stress protein [Pseudomonadales bacterium]|jgi:nucleotide-binding universal stress UspA family protein|nr:universal stress protein [Pseudomonadales bacterium]
MDKFRNILFVADACKGEQAALSKILRVAHQTRASVTVMDVVALFPGNFYSAGTSFDFDEWQQKVKQTAHERLEQLVKNCARSVPLPNLVIREGVDYIEIIRQVNEGHHDLVAKAAATDSSFADVLFGLLDMHLLRKCPCPVLIIKPRKKIVHPHVVVALDIDEPGPKGEAMHLLILDHAAGIAGFEEGSLDILHAWTLPYEQNLRREEKTKDIKTVDILLKETRKRKQQRLEALSERWDLLEPRVHLIKGIAQEVIPRFVRDHGSDLLVMGTVGRTGIKGFFMGNTAEKILHALNCSVLAIKPQGFKSPVS